jgi:hypothetical protein
MRGIWTTGLSATGFWRESIAGRVDASVVIAALRTSRLG